jgi:hypothetical protein
MSAIVTSRLRCKRPVVAKQSRRIEQTIFRTIVEMAYEMNATEQFPAGFKHVKLHVETQLYKVHSRMKRFTQTKAADPLNPDREPALPKFKRNHDWFQKNLRISPDELSRHNIYIDGRLHPLTLTTSIQWRPSICHDNGEPLQWKLEHTLWISGLAYNYTRRSIEWEGLEADMSKPFDEFRKDVIKLLRNHRFTMGDD